MKSHHILLKDVVKIVQICVCVCVAFDVVNAKLVMCLPVRGSEKHTFKIKPADNVNIICFKISNTCVKRSLIKVHMT